MICDLPTYRRITGDVTTIDGDVTRELTNAQDTFERLTGRWFENAQRTEVLRLYDTGRVYPKAFPITAVGQPTDGSEQGVVDGAAILIGYGYQYAEGINPFVSGFGANSANYQPQVTITYTGGYLAADMPYDVKRAVAVLAYNQLHINTLSGVPVGANNVHLGDVSISGTELSGLNPVSASVASAIRRWRRPMVEAF